MVDEVEQINNDLFLLLTIVSKMIANRKTSDTEQAKEKDSLVMALQDPSNLFLKTYLICILFLLKTLAEQKNLEEIPERYTPLLRDIKKNQEVILNSVADHFKLSFEDVLRSKNQYVFKSEAFQKLLNNPKAEIKELKQQVNPKKEKEFGRKSEKPVIEKKEFDDHLDSHHFFAHKSDVATATISDAASELEEKRLEINNQLFEHVNKIKNDLNKVLETYTRSGRKLVEGNKKGFMAFLLSLMALQEPVHSKYAKKLKYDIYFIHANRSDINANISAFSKLREILSAANEDLKNSKRLGVKIKNIYESKNFKEAETLASKAQVLVSEMNKRYKK